jgi:membrane protein YqaA with SNARE-associated domain
MEAFVGQLIAWFALPRNGLSSLFVVAFISATLLPMGSEPALFAFIKLDPTQYWWAIGVATVGNTLGGVVDYWMGWGASGAVPRKGDGRYLRWFARLGPKAMVLAWLPVVGDPLCTVGGWLRLPFWPCVAWMALGKFLRYVAMTSVLLWVPDAWWLSVWRSIVG